MADLTKEQEKLLKEYYYDKKNFVGRDKLYDLIKDIDGHPTKVQVLSWLKKQEVYQLHFKPRKSSTIAPVITTKPNVIYQIDLIDMGSDASHGKRYILTAIDAFTKFAMATPLVNKEEKSVTKALEKIILDLSKDGKSIHVIQSDNGAEFVNDKFEEMIGSYGIKHITGIAGRPQSQGIIERFNGSLKDYIHKDITATGKNEWPKNLQTYLDNYNNSYHRTIKTTPNDAYDEVSEVADNIKKRALSKHLITKSNLEKGDKVRVKIFKGKLEKSSTKNFSDGIYTVEKVIKSKKPYIQPKIKIKTPSGKEVQNSYVANDLLKITEVQKSKTDQPIAPKTTTTQKNTPKPNVPFSTSTRKKQIDFKTLSKGN